MVSIELLISVQQASNILPALTLSALCPFDLHWDDSSSDFCPDLHFSKPFKVWIVQIFTMAQAFQQ